MSASHAAVGATRLTAALLLLLLAPLAQAFSGKDHQKDADSRQNNVGQAAATEPFLLAATLDGRLIALQTNTGEVLWEHSDDDPVVRSPHDKGKEPVLPAFLPDPTDGSIYMVGNFEEHLKKLPFTIPELVAASPCKSNDGMLYAGRKVDTWFAVERATGRRKGALSFEGCLADDGPLAAGMGGEDDICPRLRKSGDHFLMGRTEYSITMYDSKTTETSRRQPHRWNITFFDYTPNVPSLSSDDNYGFVHFTESSSGTLLTMHKATTSAAGGREAAAAPLWEGNFGSPIVNLFLVGEDGLVHVPFTAVSNQTLTGIVGGNSGAHGLPTARPANPLMSTLYIGEHKHGLYAMQSFVDRETLTISNRRHWPLLLEGPKPEQQADPEDKAWHSGKVSGNQDQVHHVRPAAAAAVDPLSLPTEMNSVESKDLLLLGYYNIPEKSDIQFISNSNRRLLLPHVPSGSDVIRIDPNSPDEKRRHLDSTPPFPDHQSTSFKAISGASSSWVGRWGEQRSPRDYDYGDEDPRRQQCSYNVSLIDRGLGAILALDAKFVLSSEFARFVAELAPMTLDVVRAWENKEMKLVVLLLVVIAVALVRGKANNNNNNRNNNNIHSLGQTSEGSKSRQSHGSAFSSTRGSASGQSGLHSLLQMEMQPIELESGHVMVGKIVFDPDHVLGKGCEGTFVYKGTFDGREVAVKRVLSACFSIADREVRLLRESDEHPNVIRYFCTEQDRQFRYIALELCVATLQDYVERGFAAGDIGPLTVLRHATQGLHHLHSLGICHRDIKPQNVLISTHCVGSAYQHPAAEHQAGRPLKVKAMISDFGLCKKLQTGKASFSRRSGITGTEGWIAPEMMLGSQASTCTCAVDVFSLGCVYYFVLSGGHHPFGESFRRQANILASDFDLSHIIVTEDAEGEKIDRLAAVHLVEAMIQRQANSRPPTAALLLHPLFWDSGTSIGFFQAVSDRIDLVDGTGAPAAVAIRSMLELGARAVVNNNWLQSMHPEVAADLRRRRTYNGRSVCDLLRAFRNKRNHFQELPSPVKDVYGRQPHQYLSYWTSRFPDLLLHTWCAVQQSFSAVGGGDLGQDLCQYFHPKYVFRLKNLAVCENGGPFSPTAAPISGARPHDRWWDSSRKPAIISPASSNLGQNVVDHLNVVHNDIDVPRSAEVTDDDLAIGRPGETFEEFTVEPEGHHPCGLLEENEVDDEAENWEHALPENLPGSPEEAFEMTTSVNNGPAMVVVFQQEFGEHCAGSGNALLGGGGDVGRQSEDSFMKETPTKISCPEPLSLSMDLLPQPHPVGGGPIWILPPDQNGRSSKKKKKKVKKDLG